MKKVFLILGLIVAIFIAVTYFSLTSTSKEFSTCEILSVKELGSIDFKKHDSVLVAASTLYDGNLFKNLIQGENYRKIWSVPIKVPIVFLDTLKGGMEIIEEGGGKQTHSLELEAANGVRYTLRSITKDPKRLVPEFARTLGLENIVVDGVSAQHPYAAVVVAALADAAGILHTAPQIVFVPKQPALDDYNKKFGNRLFLLEYESEGEVNWTSLDQVKELVDTKKLQELKAENSKQLAIDQNALVRARLFDLIIGDWDRHAKQWGWVLSQTGNHLVATPLPCDRDNAFFKVDGIIPTAVSNKAFLPGVQSFENEIDYLPGLVMPFDVYFLKGIKEELFAEEAAALQHVLTDEVINAAFEVWPPVLRALSGEDITAKIKLRRDDIQNYAKGFYRILQEKEVLTEPLKGSEDIALPEQYIGCFECGSKEP